VQSEGKLLEDFRVAISVRDIDKIDAIVKAIISNNLPEPVGVHILRIFDNSYSIKDYICDIMQFLSCANVKEDIKNKLKSLKILPESSK
jgi:hypothetical protein